MKQHYVPRFYLQHFTDPDIRKPRVHVYDLPRKKWTIRNPKNVAIEDDFYTYVGRDGTRSDDIEVALERIETDAAPVIRKLIAGQAITEVEQVHLTAFAAAQMSRVPQKLEMAAEFQADVTRLMMLGTYDHMKRHPDQFPAYIEERKQAGIEGVETLTIEDLNPDRYKISVRPSSMAGVAIAATLGLAPDIHRNMGYQLLRSEGRDFFVTSDHPFFMTAPGVRGPVGLATKGVEATLPLSRNLCLLLENENPGAITEWKIGPNGVKEINSRTAALAKRFIAAPSHQFPGPYSPPAGHKK